MAYQILKPIRKQLDLKQRSVFARICSQIDRIESPDIDPKLYKNLVYDRVLAPQITGERLN